MAKYGKDGVHVKSAPDKSEEYVRGHRSGVEGSYGEPHDGVAEKTIWQGEGNSDGGGEDGLGECAHRLYQRAVENGDGSRNEEDGDQALYER